MKLGDRITSEETLARTELATEIERAKALLETHQSDWRAYIVGLASLYERLTNERLQLAVLGQFKRGKSTFINALLGAPVLPVVVVPLTAVAVFIALGPDPIARVRFRTGGPPEEFRSTDPRALQELRIRNPTHRLLLDESG